jgi:predicted DNA-binding protein (MmcQ/YjbR family)
VAEIKGIVRTSYNLVLEKLPKKLRSALL